MRWAMGLMSGTSLDGVDAALLKTNGQEVEEVGAHLTLPYPYAFRTHMSQLINGAADMLNVQRELTEYHVKAVQQLLLEADMKASEISVIGFHGQTIAHRPKAHQTWQIGDGAFLAEQTGIDVVTDFRRRDMAAGGQGAPLVPVYHLALATQTEAPMAIINLGGISNMTYIGAEKTPQSLMAFDMGPGNTLVDRWMEMVTGKPYDYDGKYGLKGTVDEEVLADLLQHPRIQAEPPKSLDTQDFDLDRVKSLSLEDGAATLAAFTAQAIAEHLSYLPQEPKLWVIAGGGAHNKAIMHYIKKALPNKVTTADAMGWHTDAMEAQAFAYLAVRSLEGLPLTFPETTGVSYAVTGGAFYRAVRDASA